MQPYKGRRTITVPSIFLVWRLVAGMRDVDSDAGLLFVNSTDTLNVSRDTYPFQGNLPACSNAIEGLAEHYKEDLIAMSCDELSQFLHDLKGEYFDELGKDVVSTAAGLAVGEVVGGMDFSYELVDAMANASVTLTELATVAGWDATKKKHDMCSDVPLHRNIRLKNKIVHKNPKHEIVNKALSWGSLAFLVGAVIVDIASCGATMGAATALALKVSSVAGLVKTASVAADLSITGTQVYNFHQCFKQSCSSTRPIRLQTDLHTKCDCRWCWKVAYHGGKINKKLPSCGHPQTGGSIPRKWCQNTQGTCEEERLEKLKLNPFFLLGESFGVTRRDAYPCLSVPGDFIPKACHECRIVNDEPDCS